MASQVLSGLIHCKFISAEESLIPSFTKSVGDISKRRRKRKRQAAKGTDAAAAGGGGGGGGTPPAMSELLELHAGVLGLCAYVSAFPYDVPAALPGVLLTLSEHLNDPHPVPDTIKKTLSSFRRTHHDNWRDHKQRFTEEQLDMLTDLLLSPSYYA